MADGTTLSNQSWNYDEQHALTRGRQGRLILRPAMVSNPSVGFTSLSLHDQIRDFFEKKEKLENDIKAINQMMLVKELQKQLAPGQNAYVVQTKTSSGLTIDRVSTNLPGSGILYDPGKTVVTQISGPPLDQCPLPGKPVENVSKLRIDNRDYSISGTDQKGGMNNPNLDFGKDTKFDQNSYKRELP